MAELRCRLQSLTLAMLGRAPAGQNENKFVGWASVPLASPQAFTFMRTLFPCSHWIYTTENITNQISGGLPTNSSLLYRLPDLSAHELNGAAHWLNVSGCEFKDGSTIAGCGTVAAR